jgi:uncharacterized protein (DUF2147 family)
MKMRCPTTCLTVLLPTLCCAASLAAEPAAPAPAPAAPDAATAAAPAARVDFTSPVGRWKTFDDGTGKAKSIVVITEEGGKLYGHIEKLLDPKPDNPDPVCTKCEGAQHNLRVTGMRILWDLAKDGDEWSGGKVLDPDNGKIYKVYIAVKDGGTKLKVRGYIGFSLLGRTQQWVREP